MIKNSLYRFIKGFISVLIFPLWLIIHPVLMFMTSFLPSFSNTKLFRASANYGDKVNKHLLTGERSSRSSFTFAHGLLHFLIFLFSLSIAIWFYKYYINQSTAVRNKHLIVEANKYYPPGHIKADKNDMLESFQLWWDNTDSLYRKHDNPSCDPRKSLSFRFFPEMNEKDTSYFLITVHADFDLKIDTTDIRENLKEKVDSNIFNYEIRRFGEIDGKHYIVIDLVCLPLRDYVHKIGNTWVDSVPECFMFNAHPEMFDENDPPYLNFYLDFHLDLKPIKPDEISNNNIFIMYCDSVSFLQDTDSTYISGYPYFCSSYELIESRPEQNKSGRFWLDYWGNSLIEINTFGLYFKFVNHELEQQENRKAFFNTVLFGALISFLLTIIVELLTKWRNLNLRSGNKDPYSDNE